VKPRRPVHALASDTFRFLLAFLRDPVHTGAIAPSTEALARAMTEWIGWDEVRAVLELGPGTGVFTAEILRRLPPGARFVAIELNAQFVGQLRQRFPGVEVCQDNVGNLEGICAQQGVGGADAILSGLPWAAFPPALQDRCLHAITRVLRPGGQFCTFAYLQGLCLPAGRRFRRLLEQHFPSVERSSTVWRNLPPALVYRCRR
jgi:phosphatidylethanolamine/phosphatidyl-N-methylethanolamine N-methyltransferase